MPTRTVLSKQKMLERAQNGGQLEVVLVECRGLKKPTVRIGTDGLDALKAGPQGVISHLQDQVIENTNIFVTFKVCNGDQELPVRGTKQQRSPILMNVNDVQWNKIKDCESA